MEEEERTFTPGQAEAMDALLSVPTDKAGELMTAWSISSAPRRLPTACEATSTR